MKKHLFLYLLFFCCVGFQIESQAAFQYSKDNVYRNLKKNYETLRVAPQKLAKLMDHKSQLQYLAHLKKYNIKELPKIDILPSGVYVPSLKMKMEFVEVHLAKATVTWKVNGKDLVWKLKDDFNTHMKLYTSFQASLHASLNKELNNTKISLWNWILPEAHADAYMQMPYTFKNTYLEGIYYVTYAGMGSPAGIDLAEAKEAVCVTADQDKIGNKTPAELTPELQFLANIQNKYSADYSGCAERKLTQAVESFSDFSGNADIAADNIKCNDLRDMQKCLTKMATARINIIRTCPTMSSSLPNAALPKLPDSCFYQTRKIASEEVQVLNSNLDRVDYAYLGAIYDRIKADRKLGIDLNASVQEQCYTIPPTDPNLPIVPGSK